MSILGRLRNTVWALPVAFGTAVGAAACGGSSPNLPPGVDPRMVYKNNPGNEFPVMFTARVAPEGRQVMIDPDDLMPMQDPRDGGLTFTFRANFLSKINDSLPNVPGGPSVAQLTQMKETEGAYTVKGEDVVSLMVHLENNHGTPTSQIWGARDRSVEIRLRDPAFKDEKLSAHIFSR